MFLHFPLIYIIMANLLIYNLGCEIINEIVWYFVFLLQMNFTQGFLWMAYVFLEKDPLFLCVFKIIIGLYLQIFLMNNIFLNFVDNFVHRRTWSWVFLSHLVIFPISCKKVNIFLLPYFFKFLYSFNIICLNSKMEGMH